MATPLRAYIQSNEPVDAARRHIIAVVTDDITKALNDVTVSSIDELKRVLRATSMQVETSKELDALTPGTELDLTIPPPEPPVPPVLSQDDQDINEFTARAEEWQAALQLIAGGFEAEGYADAPLQAALAVYQKASPAAKRRCGIALLVYV